MTSTENDAILRSRLVLRHKGGWGGEKEREERERETEIEDEMGRKRDKCYRLPSPVLWHLTTITTQLHHPVR